MNLEIEFALLVRPFSRILRPCEKCAGSVCASLGQGRVDQDLQLNSSFLSCICWIDTKDRPPGDLNEILQSSIASLFQLRSGLKSVDSPPQKRHIPKLF